MKKLLCGIAVISTALSAAQEHTGGMLNFGVTRTALERINSEMNDFPGSTEADQFKPKYDKIHQQLMNPVGDDEQDQIQQLINLVALARKAASYSATGKPSEWTYFIKKCDGHTYSKKYESHRKALDEGKKIERVFMDKEEVDTVSLYEVKQHGSKTDVAGGVVMSSIGAGTGTGVAVLMLGATGVAAPVIGTVWLAGWFGATGKIAADTKKEYDSIKYEMSLKYKHKETHLYEQLVAG